MIEFMVVRDESLPAGHEWAQVDFGDGHLVVFLAEGGAIRQKGEPITVRGVTYQVVDNHDPFEWEWCRIKLCDGTERILWNRESMAYRTGYAQCNDDGTPVAGLRLVS